MRYIKLTKILDRTDVALRISDITEIEESTYKSHHGTKECTKVYRGDKWVKVEESFQSIMYAIDEL